MSGALVVGYLFLGGAGAATLAICALIDGMHARNHKEIRHYVTVNEASVLQRVLSYGMLVGFALLALGVLCLLFHLGRIDRVLYLFLRPSWTYMSVGAYALSLLLFCGAMLLAVRFLYVPFISRWMVAVVEVLVVVLGFIAMLYTGLLLQSMAGIAFWHSFVLPMLFVLSSLSCGIALLLLVIFLTDGRETLMKMVHVLVWADIVLIVLEAICAGVLVQGALMGDHLAAQTSAIDLLVGDLSLWWWLGFFLCGLLVPLVVEAALSLKPRSFSAAQTAIAVVAVLVLVGGFSMRNAIVEVGTQPELTSNTLIYLEK